MARESLKRKGGKESRLQPLKKSSKNCYSTQDDEIQELVHTVQELTYDIDIHQERWKHLGKFMKTSMKLSSFFPKVKDSSIFEIDDLLYPNTSVLVTSMSCRSTEELRSFLACRCFHFCNLDLQLTSALKRSTDTLLLQMIENTSKRDYKKSVSILISFITTLLTSRTGKNTCRAIKFLKFSLDKYKELTKKALEKSFDACSLLTIHSTRKLPKAKDDTVRRMVSWMSRHWSLIFMDIKTETLSKEMSETAKIIRMLRKKEHDERYIKTLDLHYTNWLLPSPVLVDHLYSFFSSAKNETQKLERAKDFFQGCKAVVDLVPNYTNICSIISYAVMYSLFREFILTCEYPNDLMKLDDSRHCNDLEPYILGNQIYSENQEMIDYQPDFTLERSLIYDHYLKSLYVMSKLHEAYMMCEEPLKAEELADQLFRRYNDFQTYFVIGRLIFPAKRGDLPWWFQTMLRKCPILFLSNCHENMIDDLIKMLKGEEIDEVTTERLCHVVNVINSSSMDREMLSFLFS